MSVRASPSSLIIHSCPMVGVEKRVRTMVGMPAYIARVIPTNAARSVIQLTESPSNSTNEPSTKLTVAIAVQARHTRLDVDLVAEHGESSSATPMGRGQHRQPVAAEDERPGAHHPGDPHARGVQLEQQQGQADHEQQVRHRRAGHGVHELPDQAQAAELHLLGVGDLAIAVDHLGLDTGELDDELTDHRRIGVDEAELDGPAGAHAVAHVDGAEVAGSDAAGVQQARRVTSMLEPGAMPVTPATATRRTDSPAALLPRARSRRRPGPTRLPWWRSGRRAPRPRRPRRRCRAAAPAPPPGARSAAWT